MENYNVGDNVIVDFGNLHGISGAIWTVDTILNNGKKLTEYDVFISRPLTLRGLYKHLPQSAIAGRAPSDGEMTIEDA